jgi:hypothetical protein
MSCSEPGAPQIFAHVRSQHPLESLTVWLKRYNDDGTVFVAKLPPQELPATRENYALEQDDPLRLHLTLPSPGRHAVHLIGIRQRTDDGGPVEYLTTTFCLDVKATVTRRDLALLSLPATLDMDRDTIPEDLEAYCAHREAEGGRCDRECATASYQALIDCNPAADYAEGFPPRCGEVPAPDQWHPFVDDACENCHNVDCFGDETDCLGSGCLATDCNRGEYGPRGDQCEEDDEGEAQCYCQSVGVQCEGTTWCTGVVDEDEGQCGCRDLRLDPEHCGRCDHRCQTNEVCRAGQCFCDPEPGDCGRHESCCPDAGCVNTDNDTSHCGGCGSACAYGEDCQNGQCRCGDLGGPCDASSQVCCDWQSRCVDALTDPEFCGPLDSNRACFFECAGNTRCDDGACPCDDETDCGEDVRIDCCGNQCANLYYEERHCGRCNEACRPGERCENGRCSCHNGCDDNDPCTEDYCRGTRCEHEPIAARFYYDEDGDGFGDGSRDTRNLCRAEGFYRAREGRDCDDSRADVNPDADEICDDGVDNNCRENDDC